MQDTLGLILSTTKAKEEEERDRSTDEWIDWLIEEQSTEVLYTDGK